MLEFLEDTFKIPFIFVILCYALGTGVFIGTGQWARLIAKGGYDGQNVWRFIGGWMVRGWVWVILFALSIQFGLWPEYKPENPSYTAELIILAIVVVIFTAFQLKKGNLLRAYKAEIIKHGIYSALAILIWGLTIGIFFLINASSYWLTLNVPFFEGVLDPSRDAAMVIGLLWLLPFIQWYQKGKIAQNWHDNAKAPQHYKFYMLLWPIIIGLFFFILPLFAQKVITSEKFQEALNAKPPLERV